MARQKKIEDRKKNSNWQRIGNQHIPGGHQNNIRNSGTQNNKSILFAASGDIQTNSMRVRDNIDEYD